MEIYNQVYFTGWKRPYYFNAVCYCVPELPS